MRFLFPANSRFGKFSNVDGNVATDAAAGTQRPRLTVRVDEDTSSSTACPPASPPASFPQASSTVKRPLRSSFSAAISVRPAALQTVDNATGAAAANTYALPLPMSRKPHHRLQQSPLVSPSYEYAYSTPPSSASQGGVPRGTHDSRTPSYATSSLSSSSYAGSAADEYDDGAMAADDLVSVLTDRLIGAFDPIPLDRSLALQAQTSGIMNAKTRELMELQALAQKRLSDTRKNFLDGMRIAKQVKSDLELLQKKTDALKAKAEQRYPVEYNMARERYPGPADYEY
ncbi:LOW QUALITY PROTEIN: hypothetical protein Dda_8804 [Drechslerella dactyloides]|uniref:Biogenesis of lysosome-related organelles complex 1 subunit KXD1 n=1 Tax=Drechslerella dactyloides TaxID=74499 RepID=A0AAD6IST8_DREDA|nr:LOW QUALITY PROTEIN: hypothetical protein Dda_8804 [Drechslerella dactyloides]